MHRDYGRFAGRTETQHLLHYRPLAASVAARPPLSAKDVVLRLSFSLDVTFKLENLKVGYHGRRWRVGEGAGKDIWRFAHSNARCRPWHHCRAVGGRSTECRVELAREKAESHRASLIAVSFSKKVDLPEYEQLRQPLRDLCEARGVAGDILLAANGINGTICGTQETVDDVLAEVQLYPNLDGIWRVQLPLIPGVRLAHHEQDLDFSLEVGNKAGFQPLQFLRRSVSEVFGRWKKEAQRTTLGDCTEEEPVLDLHVGSPAESARSNMSSDSVKLAPKQELALIHVAASVHWARLLGSAVVCFMSCYRNKLGDPFGLFPRPVDDQKSSNRTAEVVDLLPGAEVPPASVPWNPVVLDSRVKWQRRKGKSITQASRSGKVAGGTVSADSDHSYEQAPAVSALETQRSPGTAVNSSMQYDAQGGSGEFQGIRKKRSVKKGARKAKKENSFTEQAVWRERQLYPSSATFDLAVRDSEFRLEEPGFDLVRDEVELNEPASFRSKTDHGDVAPTQSLSAADRTTDANKQGLGGVTGVNSFDSGPDCEAVTLNIPPPVADFTAHGLSAEIDGPTNGFHFKAADGDRLMPGGNTVEGDVQSFKTLDWISQVADQREKWILDSKLSVGNEAQYVLEGPSVLPKDSAPEPLQEIASSVSARLRILQSRLVATQSALQSGRMALTEKDACISEIHSRTSAELTRASDALEFREDELLRTISALRTTRANAKAKASMDVMEEANGLGKPDENTTAGQSEGPSLKRTAKVVWPNPARQVALAGSFNGWVEQVPMRKSNAGVFVASLELHPGRYEIKFVVDGSWRVDEQRPIVYHEGYENNVLIIS